MTDNDIKIVLELLHKRILHSKIAEEVTESEIMALVEVVDLINRQKTEKEALINGQETLQKHIAEKNAEIERLRMQQSELIADYKQIAINAMKKFAERLEVYKQRGTVHGVVKYITDIITIHDVGNLLEEMEESK